MHSAPADVRDPIVSKMNLSGAPILAFTVRSARMDDEALSWFVDNTIARALLGVRGVGSVARVGGVTWGVETALSWYSQKTLWRRLVQNAMAQDYSWQTQVESYVALYERMLAVLPSVSAG